MMPIVRPAPVRPLAYSGLMSYLAARSTVVYEPGIEDGSATALVNTGTSPARAPVFGIRAARLRKAGYVLRPDTPRTMPASAAGITALVAPAWKVVPSRL